MLKRLAAKVTITHQDEFRDDELLSHIIFLVYYEVTRCFFGWFNQFPHLSDYSQLFPLVWVVADSFLGSPCWDTRAHSPQKVRKSLMMPHWTLRFTWELWRLPWLRVLWCNWIEVLIHVCWPIILEHSSMKGRGRGRRCPTSCRHILQLQGMRKRMRDTVTYKLRRHSSMQGQERQWLRRYLNAEYKGWGRERRWAACCCGIPQWRVQGCYLSSRWRRTLP